MAYALPRDRGDAGNYVVPCGEFELHDVPLRAQESFLDYEGVVVFAGVFESYEGDFVGTGRAVCVAPADLDHRMREFFTVVKAGNPFVFLAPNLPDKIEFMSIEPTCDLFRRIAAELGIGWRPRPNGVHHLSAEVREFSDYVARYGTGYVAFPSHELPDIDIKRLCGGKDDLFGFVIADKIFFLPCTQPQSHQQAVDSAVAALNAVIAYRNRVSKEMPKWVDDFRFERETSLEGEADGLRSRWEEIREEMQTYQGLKGALCLRSDPLVRTVSHILKRFFDLEIEVDDQCIEDAALKDENGNVLAVFEIKGVNRDFQRGDINQVDSHRERLGLPASTTGVLIVNTMAKATSLAEKDEPPHPDIIEKAVTDNVLMIRTLDLLRYADGVEAERLAREVLRDAIMTKAGWLKVEDDQVMIVTG